MDLHSFIINTANEHRLRRHIREVLLPYARAHLISDHISFTENAVEELLLQTLEYVPMVDPTSFLLPTEPFGVLMRSLDSLGFTLPEERWSTSTECIKYLKTFFSHPPHPRDLPTEKYWYEDDHYMKLSLECRPISSPILSNRTRRETPKLGHSTSRASIPRALPALTAFLDLKPVSVETIEDLPTPPVDNVLNLCPKLDFVTSTQVRSFLRTALVPSTRRKSIDRFEDDTPNVLDFLNRDSPPRCFPSLDSPPMFPRVAREHSIHRAASSDANSGVRYPTRTSDLASVVPVASLDLIDGEDGDMHRHHMQVVNGHSALTFSSPSPPSIHSLDRAEVDELWNISPPGTPATSLVTGVMEDIMIPRARKFGHKNTLIDESTDDSGTADLLTAAKSPGFFITSFISAPVPMTQTHKPITSQLEGIKSGMHSPRPLSSSQSTSHSLLVQPLSTLEERVSEGITAGPVDCVEDFEKQPFGDIVASIYTSTPHDPFIYIEEERINDKDTMLMDVPNLPPPTAHHKEPVLFPKGIHSIVLQKGELGFPDTMNRGSNGIGSMVLLTPAKAVKHLALDLSWRPFNFGKNVPTDEEVADIAKPIQLEDEVAGYHDEKIGRVLLDLDTPPISAENEQPTLNPKIPRGCEKFGMSPVPKRAEEAGQVEYLLTRQERSRASSAKATLEVGADIRGVAPLSGNSGHEDMLVQDKDFSQCQEYDHSQNSADTKDYCCPRSWGDRRHFFDESRANITETNLGQSSTSEFGPPLLLHQLQEDLSYGMETPESNKENIDKRSENKENIPPCDLSNYRLIDYQLDSMANQYEWNDSLDFPGSEALSFEPLSFASQSQLVGPSDDFTDSGVQDVPPLTPSAKLPEIELRERTPTNSRLAKRRRLDDLVPASSKDLFSTFIGLRNQATSNGTLEHSENSDDMPISHQTRHVPELTPPRAAPCDVVDQRTLRLPEHWVPTVTFHRYLASIAFIQKRALICELQGHQVGLVERCDLDGTDIIIDPNYGVLFVSLLALPAQLESVIERISRESWRYSNIIIICEAFPSAQSYRADRSRDAGSVPCAYTPPICKAVKKLRRNLGIAEGCGTMDPHCTISWAFANDVIEAAKFVRYFGEEACEISTKCGRGMLWDDREWLEGEEREGESDLAKVNGMNTFAAFLMLYDRSLETILDLTPEARLADYGQLLGQGRMTRLNDVIENRLRQIAVAAESVVDHEY